MIKLLRMLVLAVGLLIPSLGMGQVTSFYTDRAVATVPLLSNNGQAVLVPIAYGQVRVCNYPGVGSPCSNVATIFDLNGNPLTVQGGNFGQVTTDVVGRFSFGCGSGITYQVQVAASASNTPQLNYPITCPPNFTLTNLLPTNNTWTGTNTFASVITGINNGACVVDGVHYTTIIGAYNDTTNCKAVVVPTLPVGSCYSETVSSNWTLSRAGVPILFAGCATVSFGTNTIAVSQGNNGFILAGVLPPSGNAGVTLVYTGNASFLTVGSSAGNTQGPALKNIRFDLAGAGNASVGVDTKFTNDCDYQNLNVRGNNSGATAQIGFRFDGTGAGGSSCTAKGGRLTVAATNIGVQLNGSGSNAGNNNDLDIDTTGLAGAGSILADFEAGSNGNLIKLMNCTGATTCANFGGTSNSNMVWAVDQSITNDAIFGASSSNNTVYTYLGFPVFTDSGTNNHIRPPNSQPGTLPFVGTGTCTAAATLFLIPSGACTGTTEIAMPVPNAAQFRNLRCRATAGGVNGADGVVTVRRNFGDTTTTCTFGTTTLCSDTTHALPGTGPNDSIDIKVVTQAATTLANISCTLERE